MKKNEKNARKSERDTAWLQRQRAHISTFFKTSLGPQGTIEEWKRDTQKERERKGLKEGWEEKM